MTGVQTCALPICQPPNVSFDNRRFFPPCQNAPLRARHSASEPGESGWGLHPVWCRRSNRPGKLSGARDRSGSDSLESVPHPVRDRRRDNNLRRPKWGRDRRGIVGQGLACLNGAGHLSDRIFRGLSWPKNCNGWVCTICMWRRGAKWCPLLAMTCRYNMRPA